MTLSRSQVETRRSCLTVLVLLAISVMPAAAIAQETEDPSAIKPDDQLVLRQDGIAQRYQKLEELLLRLADVEAVENPERAALLRRAAKQSRDKFVLQQLRFAGEALRNEKFADAVNNQDSATKGLAEILKLLTSEDRANRIRDEKKRIAEMIKDLKRVERSQRSTRARTENGSDLEQLQKEQESLSDRSERLKRKFEDEDPNAQSLSETSNPSETADSNESDSEKETEGEKSEGDDQEDGGPDEDDPKDTESNQDDTKETKESSEASKDTESSKDSSKDSSSKSEPSEKESSGSEPQPSESQPSESQPSSQPSQSGEASPPQPKSPEEQARDQLQQAIERMERAQQELEDSKRDEAIEQQLAAEENLRRAIDELEQILRQLREEEMQRELARLESRLKKMAEMQSKVLDDTAELSATPKTQRSRQTDLRAGEISFEQKKITVEADRAMLLLREEGSSVAFPEVVAQIRDDSDRIAERLGKSQIDAVTQGIQQDVLAAIDEMIQALQQAQRDLEKQKQQGQAQQGQAGQQGEQPLVGQISELKLIRTMETRIKKTTERYADLLQSDDTSAQDLLPLLKNLSDRQAKLYKITRDLLLQRNQ